MVPIAHAMGRKDKADATRIFNQSLVLSGIVGALVLVGGFLFADAYLGTLAADAATRQAGHDYMVWFLPALALQFALVSVGSALRGTGITKPTMVVQVLTVVLNAILSPILIAGWGTGRPLGVMGASLATAISVAVAVVVLLVYFVKLEHFVALDRTQLRPHLATWWRMLRIGGPAGGEFLLLFVSIGINYYIVRDFGPAAQAGFGVGQRMMQAIFLPAMAVSFAAAPIAGQNLAAGLPDRVRATFYDAVKIGTLLMALATLIAHWRPEVFATPFTDDPEVIRVAALFLRIISWNFVASGIIFTCSGMFQAMGNTVPSIVSSGLRLVLFASAAFWVSHLRGFQLEWLWYAGVAATTVHALFTLWLLQVEASRRIPGGLRARQTA
jgi:putative MATE family efflux protein